MRQHVPPSCSTETTSAGSATCVRIPTPVLDHLTKAIAVMARCRAVAAGYCRRRGVGKRRTLERGGLGRKGRRQVPNIVEASHVESCSVCSQWYQLRTVEFCDGI